MFRPFFCLTSRLAKLSEALLHLTGPTSRRLRATVFSGTEPTLELENSIWPGARLRLVATYKHRGGILHDGSLHSEVRARIGSAWQAFRKHRRKVFSSPIVAARDKEVLFTTLVESSLFFGVGAWPRVSETVVRKFQATLVAMTRNMLRPHFTLSDACHLSAQFVLASARVLSANAAFHVERLRYFGSVVAKASCDLWAILRSEDSWCQHVLESLRWLRDVFSLAGCPEVAVEGWSGAVCFIKAHPAAWERLVQKGRRLALLQELWEAEVQQFQGMTYRALVREGASVPPELQCTFAGLREWSHHAFKRHGRVKESRTLIAGKQCPVCLRHFACNSRLCQHVDHASRCRWALKNAGVALAPEPGKGSKKFDDGRSQLLPATQAFGPGRQWDSTPGVEERDTPSNAVIRRLEDLFHGGASRIASWQELLDSYRECYSACCLQQTRLRATAVQWRQDLTEALEIDDDIDVRWAGWHMSAARFICDIDFASWLGEGAPVSQSSIATFQQATIQLPWLEFHSFTLPPAGVFDGSGTCIVPCREHAVVCGSDFSNCILHADCIADGHQLEFSTWVSGHVGGLILLSCRNLLLTLEIPKPVRGFRELEGPLKRLRLFSDLVRGALFFWQHGLPAVLILPPVACPAVDAVTRAAPHTQRRNGLLVLANSVIPEGLINRLTS